MKIAHLLAVAAALAVTMAGCGTATVTPTPTASAEPSAAPRSSAALLTFAPAPTGAWQPADIAQPSAVTTAPSLEPGYQCHPCHFLAENQFFGVGSSPAGLVAVGLQVPPPQAIAFVSTDGSHWVPLPGFADDSGAAAVAVVSNGARTVIVGNDPDGATAWASTGGSWTQAPRQADLSVPYADGGMTSVTAFEGGFVGGGYRDDPVHDTASAAVWRSVDGLTWHADDGSGIFAGGRIHAITAKAGVIVAVGTSGDPNYGPAATWRWTQATGWQRGQIGPDDAGAMRAVAATSSGFVAVGLNGHDTGALAWTSADGLVWTAAPDQPAFHSFSDPVRMQAVVAGLTGLVAGGWRSDAGKGSAVTWTSADGVNWQGPAWEDSFSGGQITGLVVSDGAAVAVGRTGYPDWNTATIWLDPTP